MIKKQKLELTWIGKEQPQENAKNTKNSDSLRSLRSFAANSIAEFRTKAARTSKGSQPSIERHEQACDHVGAGSRAKAEQLRGGPAHGAFAA